MKAVIIAAGMGSRIWNKTINIPKTLLPFGAGTILSAILHNFNKVGVSSFIIVVGYQSEHIRNYLKKNDCFGYDIAIIENVEWKKGNGISVLVAEHKVKNEDFILSMSDHLVSLDGLRKIVNSKSRQNLLLVDPRVDGVFDIDDATKVFFQNNRILDIGKEIIRFNGIDCGIFRLNDNYFEAMRQALKIKQDSISAAMKILIENENMEAVFLKPDDRWIDIDTPEAYQYSLENIRF